MSDRTPGPRGSRLELGIEVRVTGHPHARVNGAWKALPLDLGAAILYYLALRRTWCPRADVASLFWTESRNADAHRRLRQHLPRLKALWWAQGLEVTRDRLRWTPTTDLSAFERALDMDDAHAALGHYRGPLLDGLQIDREAEFDEWLRAERWIRHDRWRQAAFRVVDANLKTEVTVRDGALMSDVRHADPFDEAALRREMLVHAALGERAVAHRSYRRYEQWLAEEANSAPERETVELAKRLRDGASVSGALSPESHGGDAHGLPAFGAPLVGRSRLLREVTTHVLESGGPRLLTLWGPGGVGKTHLAQHVLRAWDQRSVRPALFVPLEHASEPRDVFRGIAEVLQQSDDAPAALGRALDVRAGLIVLDNLEQVHDAGAALSELLKHGQRLRVLATSRRILADALGVTIHVPPLEVLGVNPNSASPPSRRAGADDERAAEALFVVRAKSRFPGIESVLREDPESRQALRRVARLTGGLPLALVLAAGWAGTLTLPEIADQLERGLGVLRSGTTDLPERHRSVDAIFDRSWSMVPVDDRKRLAALAVFRGGFDRAAAAAVVGAEAASLRRWIDLAWIERRGARYHLHPLARRFAVARLEPGLLQRVERRHARHYAALLEAHGAALIGPGANAAMQRLVPERDNIRAAWERSTRSGWTAELARSAHGLYEFLDIARAHPERAELLQAAVHALNVDSPPDETARIARLRCEVMLLSSASACDDLLAEADLVEDDGFVDLDRALALSRASRLDLDLAAARARWERSAAVYRRLGRPGLEGSAALRFAERLEWDQRHAEMVEVLERAEALFDLAGSNDHAAVARIRRARGLGALGEERSMREELAGCRHEIRDTHPAVCRYLRVEWLHSHLILALDQGRGPRARRLLRRYLRALEAIGAQPTEEFIGNARIAEIEQDWNAALRWWRKVLNGPEIDRQPALLGVARARLALGHDQAAATAIGEARALGGPVDAWTLLELGRWLERQGDAETAAKIHHAVWRHGVRHQRMRLMRRAGNLLNDIESTQGDEMRLAVSGESIEDAASFAWGRFDELGAA